MPKRLSNYRGWLGEKLIDPKTASAYLNAARKDSPEIFFKALRKVSESRQMAKVAEDAGVSRESLYRMTSATGNPTHSSFEGILKALGLDFLIVPLGTESASAPIDGPQEMRRSSAIIESGATAPGSNTLASPAVNYPVSAGSTLQFNPSPFSVSLASTNPRPTATATPAANNNLGEPPINYGSIQRSIYRKN